MLSRLDGAPLRYVTFHPPEHSFRKLSANHKQPSRTRLREDATDVRWARLKRSTRAACAHLGERPCYANLLLDLLPQLLSAPWRWPLPPLPQSRGAAAGVAVIITTSAMASASALSVAAMATTDAM